MYCRNEYYRPYSARPNRQQRLPAEDATLRRQRPARISPPPPPPSSSPRSTPGLLLPEDTTECTCRLSPLLKGGLFLCVLLAASAGLVIFFLTRNPAMDSDVQLRGEREPTAESRVRDSFESRFENSQESRRRNQEPDLSLIKLEGFEVITQGDFNIEELPEVSRTSSSESATTSMSSSTSMVTSSSKGFSPATNPLLTTSVFSEFAETTVPEVEEDVVTVQPLNAAEKDFEKEGAGDEIEKEGAGDESDELSESDYFYSIYGDEYPFDYADYINYRDEDFEDSVSSNGSPVKTFTVGQDSGQASPSRSIPTDSPPSSSFPPRTPRPLPSASYVTETVFGFLDFVTTVGDTVMVFTPANAEAEQSSLERQSSIKVPPTLTLTSTPSLGLESLFDSLDRQEASSSLLSSSVLSTASSFIPTIQPSTVEEAKQLVSIIRSDFYGPEKGREGLVAATQRTLVKEGATTIFSTEVEGTHLAGEYVQLVRSGSEVLGPATTPGPGFPGSAQLTSLPTIALETSLETEQKPKRFDSGESGRANKARESLEEVRKSANLSFKERLKQRFQKFREEHGSVLDREPSRGFGRAIGQAGRDRDRQDENTVSFGKKSDIIRNKLHQVLNKPVKVTSTAILTRTFVPAHLRTTVSPTTSQPLIDPSTSRHFLSILREAPTRGPLHFPSSSDRFKPPEIRKNLLNRVLGKLDKEDEEELVTTEQNEEPEEGEKTDTQIPAEKEEELPIIQSGIDDEEDDDEMVTTASRPLVLLDNINLEAAPVVQVSSSISQQDISAPPQSTLHVATLPLPNTPESYLEVITVRSPYSFEVEEQDEQSTRFITVTQTLTSAIEPTPVLDNTPLFDFDGDVPNPSPVLLEDIYDGTSLRPIPTNFIDFDLELDQEESINQETILPAEAPSVNALKSEDVERKEATPTPVIEPSFIAAPNPVTELGLAPAQLQYLQLIGAQLTDLQPKVVTLTAPVLTTEEAYETQTLTVGLAGKELVTTLVTPIGLTTRTAFTYLTTTINPAIGPLVPSTTLVSSPVIQNTVLTETETQHYRILFRNRPITTTLTNTRLVTTQMTTFVTETVTLQPPSPLLAGILG